jgi:hypothetical protein
MKTVSATLLTALLAALAFAASAAPTIGAQSAAAEPQSATFVLNDEDKDKDKDKEGPKKD